MGSQLELNFETNDTFEDIFPGDPPRALGLEATDTTTGEVTNLGRLDPDPDVLAAIPNDKLLNPDDGSNARAIDPGAGGPPKYGTPWRRLPQGVPAPHAHETHQDILQGEGQGMAHMEAAGDVGRRHHDGVGMARRGGIGGEGAGAFPQLVMPGFDLGGPVGFFKRQRLFLASACSSSLQTAGM